MAAGDQLKLEFQADVNSHCNGHRPTLKSLGRLLMFQPDTGGLSFQPTGHECDECGGSLHDILLDWEDPVLEMDRAEEECTKADLVLCLGTSLRIEPVGNLPLLAKEFVIVNLFVV